MKTALFFWASVFAAGVPFAAFGYPVGSQVQYSVSIDKQGQKTSGQMWAEILSIRATDRYYRVRQTIDIGQTPQVMESWSTPDAVDGGNETLRVCGKNGGTAEDISVPAGKFSTCRFDTVNTQINEQSSYWLSDVPFQVVRSVESQGDETILMELKSVTSP